MSGASQLVLPMIIDTRQVFDNYYAQDNLQLYSLLSDVSRLRQSNLVYCFGKTGAGKSHLMFALVAQSMQCDTPVSYLNAQLQDVRQVALAGLKYSGIVVIDDVDSVAHDKDKEEAVFAIYEEVKKQSGCLCVTAKKPASQCEFLLPDLVSRLQSDLRFQVHELNDESRKQAIRLRAKQRGLSISSESIAYLLTHSSRDNSVFTLFDEIDKTALQEKRNITIPFIKRLLNE